MVYMPDTVNQTNFFTGQYQNKSIKYYSVLTAGENLSYFPLVMIHFTAPVVVKQ